MTAGAPPRPRTALSPARRWLRLKGAVLAVGSLIACSATGQPWWLVPLTLLAPDLPMVGYAPPRCINALRRSAI
jgi:hypothetical protein